MSSSASARVEVQPRAGVRTRPHLAPGAIQGLEVLALPITELNAYVQQLVERNPLLDVEGDEFSVALDELLVEDAPADEGREWWEGASDGRVRRIGVETAPIDVGRLRDDCSVTEGLHSHLRMQLEGVGRTQVPQPLLEALIDCIDDNGYFDGSLPVVCAEADYLLEEGEAALAFIQTLQPRGVGARNLRECLLLQIDDGHPYADVMRALIQEGLDDLAQNRTTKLTRAYHLTLDDLTAVRESIASLNPRPGASFSQRKTTVYVIPDLVVERREQGFGVRVVGELSERLIQHDEYEQLVADSGDAEAMRWLDSKRAEANLAVANVSQRKRTLFRFGSFLLEAQYDFFCRGEAALRPLTMQQVADSLGIHVSTVSRIVQDKHILTPWGTYPLKFFFDTALSCSRGLSDTALSSRAIKERIKELIAKENARTPYSDAALTDILNAEGIDIKRRTVAKYREALGIPRQSQRRR